MKPNFRIVTGILLILVLALLGCSGCAPGEYKPYPTYPSGGDYDYGGGSYDLPDYVHDALGEWEGFMWEEYRSDHRTLGKKKVAVRIQYKDSTYTSSGWRDWVRVNVLIDGRPAASTIEEIRSGGYLHLETYQGDIDLDLKGWFRHNKANGDIDLVWDEKFDYPWGDTDFYRVRSAGDFELGHVTHLHWASAWELFDTYGDEIWDLPEETWYEATLDGMEYLESIEETLVRTPVE
ncbi:hypothetical protein KAU08_01960 [bacterium]|nr:hypothetical protein [bacterium]